MKTHPRAARRSAVAGLIATFLLGTIGVLPVAADTTAQSLPFAQDWTNTGLITTSDSWAGVPGIVGYRGDGLAVTGADPQQVTPDSDVVDVNANQASPNTFTTGGVAEFEIADPVVALQGSGTADAPFIAIAVDTTGLSDIHVSYNLRDIDGSADNAVQQVALQYRVGASGSYTNVPAGYVADATTGPSLATLVTPVSVTLPAGANDQPIVMIRIITADATGSDEWVGIDDIVVSTADAAPAVQSTTPANDATNVAPDANVSVTFTEPVDVTGAWFTIVCATSGAHTATVTGGPTTFTLDPDTDFAFGETCTVTIVASQVSDQDTDDPPDIMPGDYIIDITTEAVVVVADINISQVYGGGGNSGSTYKNDFIELFNPGAAPASLAGWSVQYASATGSTWQVTPLAGSIPAGSYYLIQEAAGAGGVISLPTPDVTGTIAMGATAGKVALVASTAALTGPCPAGGAIVDFVGFGTTANCFEGTGPTLAPSNINAVLRAGGGATDTDNNASDFATGAPTPRPTVDPAPTVGSTTPANGATGIAFTTNVTISFAEPVAVSGSWFSIVCADSGVHTATASGGPITFTLDPAADFTDFESCTVTVVATQVTDRDTQDPPDPMAADFVFTFTTMDVEFCGDPATFIHDIQGAGAASPLAGESHAIEGIVVGDYEGSDTTGLGGFFVQEEDADADANTMTSEGIFVFTGGTPSAAATGDHVRVRGTVVEFNGLTELSPVSLVLVCAAGNPLPTSTTRTLPVAALADWEPVEGMLVTIDDELTVTETFTLGRFGEVALSVGGRLSNPTNVVAPGAPANALQDLNDRSRILLDDGRGGQNADPTTYPTGGLSASNTLRIGDTVAGPLTGVLDFGFDVYRIQPVGPISFDMANPRPAAPASVGGNVRVASFNVLNYFNGDGLGGGFPTARGAEDLFEFGRQRAKIVSAVLALDADIVGLMELENDPTPDSAIEDLVAGLNAVAGAGTYAFIDTGVVGGDEIRVALIYRPASVTPIGAHAILDSTVDPAFIDTLNRPVVAQTFERKATGARLTVAVNHLKSKGTPCPGDPDLGDGQGNCNATRTAAAEALVDWLATDPTGSGDPDFLIIGDLNAYALEDPITAIRDAGYTNLVADRLGEEAYSYVFGGQSGYLDHALASASLDDQVSGVTDWHINADEPVVLDYNTNFKSANHVTTLYAPDAYRSSDHDPVVVGLELNASPTVDGGGPYAVIEGESVLVSATGSDPDGDALSYAWDLDNDGTFETVGQSATFSAAGIEAPATRTIRVRATDTGGSSATDTATVHVIWAFSGFLPPLDGASTKDVTAGKTIVIKFSLDGDQGLDIFRDGYPASEAYECGTTPPSDATEPALLATPTGFRYDSLRDEYVFEWKTDKDWQDSCRVFVLGLADGTTHDVTFHFRETMSTSRR